MARQSAASAKSASSAVAKAPAKKKATTNKPQAQPAGPLVRPEGRTKFTLYNLLGQPRAYYVVDAQELKRPPVDPKAKQVAHSILVVDRSGSMSGSMKDL